MEVTASEVTATPSHKTIIDVSRVQHSKKDCLMSLTGYERPISDVRAMSA
jgi:hypothetical protein